MRRRIASPLLCVTVVIVVACGATTTSTAVDGGALEDGQAAPEGGAPKDGASSDALVCVVIDPNAYDRSCNGDSDCTLIPSGTLCTGGCGCNVGAVNKKESAKVQAATSSVKLLACPCDAPGVQHCVQGTCTLCTFGPNAPPGCPDAG